MGYSLWFGEFDVVVEKADRYVRGTARTPDHEGPLNSTLDRGASCRPGYSAWGDFTRRVGLYDLFFDKSTECLICQHPGVVAVTEDDHAKFEAALAAHKQRHHIDFKRIEEKVEAAERNPHTPFHERYANVSVAEWDALRLRWLTYWSRYVLDHCEYPSFANS